jgi:hypothetical protein
MFIGGLAILGGFGGLTGIWGSGIRGDVEEGSSVVAASPTLQPPAGRKGLRRGCFLGLQPRLVYIGPSALALEPWPRPWIGGRAKAATATMGLRYALRA